MTARRENLSPTEKALTDWRICSLETAGRAAKEPSFDSDRPLTATFTLPVYHEVAPFNEAR